MILCRLRRDCNLFICNRTVVFSPGGNHIITGSQMGKINFFSTETGQREQQLDTRGKYTLSIAYVCDRYISFAF